MKHQRKWAFAPAILCAAFASTIANAEKSDDTLRVAMAEEILNLYYNYTTKREYIILAQLTDTTLFSLDPVTQEFNPAVATGYDYIDETTLDVFLRDDVKFHDGSILTADDVAYTYNWIVREDSESNASGTVGRWLDNAEVTGPNTVRFHLKTVYPLVLRDMAQRIMLRKADTYDADGVIDRDAMAQDLIGTGPYRVVSIEPGQELILERFDDFFGDQPSIENVVVRTIPDIGTQQAEIMSGGIDWMFKVPLDLAQSLGGTPMATHLSGPDLRVAFIVLDAAG
ncbi:ABC transporter substrate-binding protein [Yoonia maritima]|uniref:ABC transporter substrate-binding protein n=1 Tax=Yoonia maritima TaxID=1435347 RepID=UPI000D0ED1FB|nr:ABC transporter substrate-binding protein [Yoonia maritima]